MQFEENSFTIDASYWENAKVNYADIDNIEYREQDDPGRRVLGFGSSKLLLGEFENDEFGSYTRYSYTKCDSCVVLSVGDRILVINGENDDVRITDGEYFVGRTITEITAAVGFYSFLNKDETAYYPDGMQLILHSGKEIKLAAKAE